MNNNPRANHVVKPSASSATNSNKRAQNAGLPNQLKSGIKNATSMRLDNVQVHYNSSNPASVQAHAYAQGTNIHLASGQANHPQHELGHAVQQMAGGVKTTTRTNGMAVNDNPRLEKEADVMGANNNSFGPKSFGS